MYAKLNNGVIEKYPYTIGDLRKDNPNTSFPSTIAQSTLDEYGVVSVEPTEKPVVDHTKNVTEGTPQLNGKKAKQVWIVSVASESEIAQRTEEKAQEVRADRDSKLSGCDWTQLPDAPLDADQKLAWSVYRQKLRDVSKQPDFPWLVIWPEKS